MSHNFKKPTLYEAKCISNFETDGVYSFPVKHTHNLQIQACKTKLLKELILFPIP